MGGKEKTTKGGNSKNLSTRNSGNKGKSMHSLLLSTTGSTSNNGNNGSSGNNCNSGKNGKNDNGILAPEQLYYTTTEQLLQAVPPARLLHSRLAMFEYIANQLVAQGLLEMIVRGR